MVEDMEGMEVTATVTVMVMAITAMPMEATATEEEPTDDCFHCILVEQQKEKMWKFVTSFTQQIEESTVINEANKIAFKPKSVNRFIYVLITLHLLFCPRIPTGTENRFIDYLVTRHTRCCNMLFSW